MDKLEELDFKVLLKGYLDESLSPGDLEAFLRMAAKPEYILMMQLSFEKDLLTDAQDLTNVEQSKDSWSRLEAKLETPQHSVRSGRFNRIVVAASVCLLCVLGALYLVGNGKPSEPAKTAAISSLPSWLQPEHIGATLYTANGDSIVLDNQVKGVIATQDGLQVFQSAGTVSYAGSGGEHLFNEVRTERGKLFRCILPDQTIAWLNGKSSIKFPLHFDGSYRSVEITGEVYFEVVHNPGLPFRVKAGEQLVEDIGTAFNVDASAEHRISTTLIEGSVSVLFNDKKEIMKPGEQVITSGDKNDIILDQHANIEKIMAWKNGVFYFHHDELPAVMSQLADWYHVDVMYQGNETKAHFSGQIDKSLSLTQVLRGLQQPGVAFTLNDDHQIVVVQK